MRKRLNAPQKVQRHLDSLQKKYGDMEAICTQCGDCCMASIQMGDQMFVVPELPCRFLVPSKNGKLICSVYPERHHVAPWCRDLLTGTLDGSYPVTCEYTKGLEGYKGGKILDPAAYKAVRPHIQEELRKRRDQKMLAEAFRAEDLKRFLKGDEEHLMKSVSSCTAVDALSWLGEHYPLLSSATVQHLSKGLEEVAHQREILQEFRGHVPSTCGIPDGAEVAQVIGSVARSLGLSVSADLLKAAEVVQAYQIGTSHRTGAIPQVYNRWLLEKAVTPAVFNIVDDAWWYQEGCAPRSQESALMGKALDLLETRNIPEPRGLFEDFSIFGAALRKAAKRKDPVIGAQGGLWNNAGATKPWNPDQRLGGIDRNSAPLWHDTNQNQFVRSHHPADFYVGAHEMDPGQFTTTWEGAQRHPEEDARRDPAKVHAEAMTVALRHGLEMHGESAIAAGLQHAIYPVEQDPTRMPGGNRWWAHHGMTKPPGWNGKWKDTTQNDPLMYDQDSVGRAAQHIQMVQNARLNGTMPPGVVNALALFTTSSRLVRNEQHEKYWPRVDKWLQSGSEDVEGLRAALRPMGRANMTVAAYEKLQKTSDVMNEGMSRFPEHGPALRHWLLQHKEFKGTGLQNSKMSLMLQLLGYSGVGCIDSRVFRHLTGLNEVQGRTVANKLPNNSHIYSQFENALRNSASYKESDPEGIRTGLAQWRMWNAQGGSDTDHHVLWKTVHGLMGGRDMNKSLAEASKDAHTMASLLNYSLDRHGAGAPAHQDMMPALYAVMDKPPLDTAHEHLFTQEKARVGHPYKPKHVIYPHAEQRYGSGLKEEPPVGD